MKNTELELLIEHLFNTLVSKAETDIKETILHTKNMSKNDFWYGETHIIEEFFCNNKVKEFFGFKEYWIDIGQPFPCGIYPLYYSEKYDFYYFFGEHVYEDYDLVKQLAEEKKLEICYKTGEKSKEGSTIVRSFYRENPTFVVIYSFDKPKFYDIESVKIQYGFYEFLENVCNIDANVIKATIDNCRERINNLSRSAGYYAKNDSVFKKALFKKVFQNVSNDFSNKELTTVCDYIINSEYAESVIRMLSTYNYTCDLYKKHPNDFIDLTFITVSLYKMIEVLFCQFVNKLFGTKTIIDRKGKTIDLSDNELTLGELNQIFYCKDETIKNYLYHSYPYSDKLKNFLKSWIKYSRNGFLHKDSIDDVIVLENSSLNSLDVFCYLILTFSSKL